MSESLSDLSRPPLRPPERPCDGGWTDRHPFGREDTTIQLAERGPSGAVRGLDLLLTPTDFRPFRLVCLHYQ
jgi:hypothetical protein